MTPLDEHYAHLLRIGFVVMRAAITSKDLAWLALEIEHLHNIPTLIGETNVHRHRYFWEQERTLYLERLAALANPEATSRMRTFYEPTWNDMTNEMQLMLGAT